MTLSKIARPALAYLLTLTMVNIWAQSGTSSALAGSVLDPSGAVISNAQVKATDVNTGSVREVQTNLEGRFLLSQINPGTYQVEVHAQGFGLGRSQPTIVPVGQTAQVNFSLVPAATSQSVEVTEQSALMSLENPNTSTTLDAKTIKSLPNPGQDLTYIAQFAQGALMNTAGSSNDAKAAGGYGNVEFNGLPATSNGYILDGFDSNDPFLGLNIGLSTNLVIGLDALQEATVNTNSYAVDQGRYGASQTNYFTKSGSNQFHGDLYEIWNGSLLNATDYFLHANDTPGNIARKPRSTVNEFGVSVGGPVLKNKLFFFTHYEGIRIALPLIARTTVPSPAYQQYVLQQLPRGGTRPDQWDHAAGAAGGSSLLPENVRALQQHRGHTDARARPVPWTKTECCCPDPRAQPTCSTAPVAPTNARSRSTIATARTSSWLRSTTPSTPTTACGTASSRTPACRPPIPMASIQSSTPTRRSRSGHLYSATRMSSRLSLVNQFNPGASWYSSLFLPNNYAQVLQIFPIVLAGGSSNAPFTTLGGNDQTYTQGRKVTQWQINDNLIWSRGRHSFKFGENSRRLDVSDYDLGEGVVPSVIYNDLRSSLMALQPQQPQAFRLPRKRVLRWVTLTCTPWTPSKPASDGP